jgi:hypothetical protein
MDRSSRVERGPSASERPAPRLVLVRREERDEIERREQPRHDVVERRRPVAKLGRFLLIELGELRLELAVDSVRSVLDNDQRLRRQWLELGRQLPVVGAQRATALEMREHAFELSDLLLERRLTGLCLRADALQPLLDVIAVGDEQLEFERLEVGARVGFRAERVDDGEQRVDLAQCTQQRGARARNVGDPDRSRRRLRGADDSRDLR